MGEKVTVVVRIEAKPGSEEAVESELRELLPRTRAEAGCVNFDLHRAVDDPAVFLVHENWVSEDALQEHFQTPYIKAWLEKADGLLAVPMELTRWARIG